MYTRLCVILMVLYAFAVQAQFTTAPRDPYNGNIPTVLNVGNTTQIKVGSSSVLGVNLYTDPQSYREWIGQLSVKGIPAFVTDTPLIVHRHSVSGIDMNWKPVVNTFGFDTNAPIAVNGVWSRTDIVTPEPIVTSVLGYDIGGAYRGDADQVPLCSNSATGTIVVCASLGKPTITFSAEPRTVMSNSPRSVTLSWSASGASECHAIGGAGFFTDTLLHGSDESNVIHGESGDFREFIIACTDTLGTVAFQSVKVSVQ